MLIQSGANIRNTTDGWSPLMIAAATHGAWSIGTQKFWGENKSNQIEAVTLLLAAGADVNMPADNGQTPLMESTADEAIDMVELLLRAGANVYARDQWGRNVLHTYCVLKAEKITTWQEPDSFDRQKQKQAQLVSLLIEAGVDINATAHNGRTPLIEATACGNSLIVELLLQAGARVDAIDSTGKNALNYAQDALRNVLIYGKLLEYVQTEQSEIIRLLQARSPLA